MEFTNLNDLDVGRIWDGAQKILRDVGLAVASERILRIIAGKLPLKDGRVCIPVEIAEHYADEIRKRFARAQDNSGNQGGWSAAQSRGCRRTSPPGCSS